MRFFYDTEFNEDGVTIDLISIGVVDENGREFYAVSTEFNPASCNEFVRTNVLPQLPPRSDPAWMSRRDIRDCLSQWLTTPEEPIELWAYYSAYDHVALAQLFGSMSRFPEWLPTRTRELMELWERAGRPPKPPQPGNQHDALADARWNLELFQTCTRETAVVDCKSPEGTVVGLIDAIITVCHVLAPRDLSPDVVQRALQDLAQDENLETVLAAGRLIPSRAAPEAP